eukprot:GHVR01042362.1.p1 GENE.GHVR01042362.1~~GHVR01042362.1.p1  ORF type:complete len:112 (+),score=19.71 GHVR01042362.1:41-337(+)
MGNTVAPSSLSPSVITNVIKIGTISRALWPLFPPLYFLDYVRKVDREMYSVELLYQNSNALPSLSKAFYNPLLPGWGGHWRIQKDLDVICSAANKSTA